MFAVGLSLVAAVLLAGQLVVAFPADISVVLGTAYGNVQGKRELSFVKQTHYAAFYGIPYAQPPVGNLRYKDPVPVQPLNSTLIAKDPTPMCMQYRRREGVLGIENCLTLHIFTPQIDGPTLDVLVIIHGGAFMYGAGARANISYLMDYPFVVVVVDYRLGVLGFLSTEDTTLPGNLGLRDQQLALKWIQENIYRFGGNNRSITLVGTSAGSVSALLHTLTPGSRGLFHRVIGLSGAPLNPWAQQSNARSKAFKLGALVGCSTNNSATLITCLRNRPAKDLVVQSTAFQGWEENPYSPFGPVIDTHAKEPFLSDHPYYLVKNGKSLDVPMILSMTSSEGIYTAAEFVISREKLRELDEHWSEYIPLILHYNDTVKNSDREKVAKMIRDKYFNGSVANNIDNLIELMSDRNFVVGIEDYARMQAASATQPVYYYVFDYQGENSISTLMSGTKEKFGVSHADDWQYFVGIPAWSNITTAADKNMSRVLLNIWANFANKSTTGIEGWLPIERKSVQTRYLSIKGPNKLEMKSAKQLGNNDFWNSLPFKENQHLNSYSGAGPINTSPKLAMAALILLMAHYLT